MKVDLVTMTPDALHVIALACRACKGHADNPSTPEEDDKLVRKVLRMGHTSVAEHVSFIFQIQGISRVCSHQLVRHRLASYAQLSQRSAPHCGNDLTIPDTINGNEKAKAVYMAAFAESNKAYDNLLALGIPQEDARYILPEGTQTSLVVSMNARELLTFFALRLCTRAQKEIRDMATAMWTACEDKLPAVFNDWWRYKTCKDCDHQCKEGFMRVAKFDTLYAMKNKEIPALLEMWGDTCDRA